MDRNDGCNRLTALVIDHNTKPFIDRTKLLKILTDLCRIHVVGAFIDVHEPGFGTRLRYRLRGRDKRVRNGNYDIAGFHAGSHQREAQRIRSATNADTVFRTAKFREGVLKLLDHRTANETSSAECTLENFGQLLLKLDMRCGEIEKWNGIFAVHF